MKPVNYFLLACALIGVAIPVFMFNPLKKGTVPFDISMKAIVGKDHNATQAQPTNNTNKQNERTTQTTPTPLQTTTTQAQAVYNPTQPTIPIRTTESASNAVTACGSDYDSVNLRVSPSIDITTRDKYGNDSQVLISIDCNQPIVVNFNRVVRNSDGVWYFANYNGLSGWINKVCFEPTKKLMYN